MSRKCAVFFTLLLVTVLFFTFFAYYTCTGTVCFGARNLAFSSKSNYDAFLYGHHVKHSFSANDLSRERTVDLEGEDVLVYLHIQKTGGATFGRHLVHDLDAKPPCKCKKGVKRCVCLTKNKRIWLFSRHSIGWACGLHADWTELNDCVDRWFQKADVKSRKFRRYHFITFLRNPVSRFLSEWQHVHRGATWSSAHLHCNGRDASLKEVPFCFQGDDWKGVTFSEFIGCKHNLAFNRMTRMLGNLSKVNCYNRTGLNEDKVSRILVKSAKKNLLDFAFFGIVEEQLKTQFLFELTFGLKFLKVFEQRGKTHISALNVTEEMKARILRTNKQDIEVYQYGKDLFYQRVEALEKRLGYSAEEYFTYYRGLEGEEDAWEEEEEDSKGESSKIDDKDILHSGKTSGS